MLPVLVAPLGYSQSVPGSTTPRFRGVPCVEDAIFDATTGTGLALKDRPEKNVLRWCLRVSGQVMVIFEVVGGEGCVGRYT